MTKYHYDKHGRYQGKTSDYGPGGGLLGLIGAVILLPLVLYPWLIPGLLLWALIIWCIVRFSSSE